MCVPLATAAIAASALSAGVGAYGAITSGNAAASAAKYNATTAMQQGQAAETAARINEQQTYRQGDQLLGRARAAAGASGVNVNSGTALLNQGDIKQATDQNVSDQTFNAELSTWGYRNQAALETAEAGADRTAGYLGAASTLIGGASQVAGKWAAYQQQLPPSSGLSPSFTAGTGINPAGWGGGSGTNWATQGFG
jgi:hypothetical protein